MKRQQIMYLWLAEGALDTAVIAWAFYDGADGNGAALPKNDPPYNTGLDAIKDGWFMLQSPSPYVIHPGSEHGTSYLPNEFVFEKTVEV